MAVVPFRVKRWGVERTGEVGDNEGVSRYSTQTVEPQGQHQQRVKTGLYKIEIECYLGQLDSELKSIHVIMAEGLLGNTGLVIPGTITHPEWHTNGKDKSDFNKLLAGTIFRFVENGRVRANEGHNDKPTFLPNGALAAYTEEQENEAPVGGYSAVPNVPPITEIHPS